MRQPDDGFVEPDDEQTILLGWLNKFYGVAGACGPRPTRASSASSRIRRKEGTMSRHAGAFRGSGSRSTAPRHRDAGAGAGRLAADQVVTGSTDEPDYRQRHPIVLTKGARTLDVFVTGHASLDGRQRDDLRAFAAVYRRTGQGAILAQMPAGARNDAGVHATMARINAELTKLGLPLGHLPSAPRRPVDLVRPRIEDRADAIRRAKVIDAVRAGQDPSTWRQEGIKINDGVGN